MERNMKYIYISRTTQCTNSGQVPACSQEPVDSTDANMVETSTCLETTQQEMTNFTVRYRSNRTGPCSAAPLSVQSSYRYQNILRIGEVLEHRIDAKISPKAASEKAQTTVSENTYTFPNIDVFRTAILSLLAPTGNNARASFWYTRYHVPQLQSCGIAECLRSFHSAFECPNIPVVRWLLTYSNYAKSASMKITHDLLISYTILFETGGPMPPRPSFKIAST